MQAIRLATQHLQARALSHIARILTRQNESAPFHQLPPEIYTRILAYSVDSTDWSISRLRKLALVSRAWCHAVRSTPQLWSVLRHGNNLPSDLSSTELQLALKNSRNSPLDVECTEGGAFCSEFLESVCRHASRWRSARFNCAGPQVSKHLAGTSLEGMESLAIIMKDGNPPQDSRIQAAVGPKLRYLSLRGWALPWHTGVWPRLEELSISQLRGEAAPSVAQIDTLLGLCRRLERLSLGDLFKDEDEDTSPLDAGRDGVLVDLPRLRSLRLYHVHTPLSLRLTTLLHAPSLAAIDVTLALGVFSPHLLPQLNEGLISNIFSSLRTSSSPTDIHIRINREFWGVRFNMFTSPGLREMEVREDGHSEIQSGVNLSLDVTDGTAALESVATLLELHDIRVPIKLRLSDSTFANDGWTPLSHAIIDRLTSVSLLEINLKQTSTVHYILDYLSQPHLQPTYETVRWPFSQLRVLNFERGGYGDGRPVLDFLKKRYGQDRETLAEVCRDVPAPLEAINVQVFALSIAVVKEVEVILKKKVHCHYIDEYPRHFRIVLVESDSCDACRRSDPLVYPSLGSMCLATTLYPASKVPSH